MEPLLVDAANGVGALKLGYIRRRLAKYISIEICNDGSRGRLNEKVCSMRMVPIDEHVLVH